MARRAGRGESGDAPVDPRSYERLSTQLSALLADMVRSQEVPVAESWAPEVMPGGRIGRFTLARELGRGGFGVVYEARDGELNRTVALKVVKPGSRLARRGSQWLLREAEAVARLNHPNIVTLHDFGQGPTGAYLVFELLRGQSLGQRIQAGPLPLDLVLEAGIAVSRALVHAHGAGVIHRDLTAANVYLGEDGAVKVLDFGLAHLFGRDGANDGGTPAYMAPEQWEGDQGDGRTDLFALGVILYQALTGQFPYKVDKGWSEALEPGETPRLPTGAGPRRLRRLVRSLLDREPELRPDNARAVRDALLALRRDREGAGRRRLLWGAVGLAAAASVAAGRLYLGRGAPPGEQVKVVLAAMDGDTTESALEAVPGLLAAALAPSPRVRVVPESRLAYLSRQAGLGEPGVVGAERGRELARIAGAAVVLVPSAAAGAGLSLRAVEAETGRTLFRATARPAGPAGLAAAVDQLADRVRRELDERAADRRLRRPVGESVTASPEAALHYYRGLDCVARPVSRSRDPARPASRSQSPDRCQGEFEQALAYDPTFPLAHFQLANLNLLPGDSGERARVHAQAALAGIGRLPARDAALVQALWSRLEGRREEALRLYDGLLAGTPEDAGVLGAVAELHFLAGDWAAAIRYNEKLVAVQPEEERPLVDLIEVLGRANRTEELRALAARLEPEGSRRARLLVNALIWLGEQERAVGVARAAVAERGEEELDTLRVALQAAGQYQEMEALARKQVAAEPGTTGLRPHVDMALTAQGRIQEALRWVGESEQLAARGSNESEGTLYRRAAISAATGDAGRVWRYAAVLQATAPRAAAELSVILALLGDLPHAARLAEALEPGSPAELQYRAVTAWRAGDVTDALARLALLESRDPFPNSGLAPAYLTAEICAAAGDDVCTLAAVGRLLRLPANRIWRAWAYPRALYHQAAARARMGEREEAARELDRVLGLLERADPEVPVAGLARALRRKL